MNTSNDAKAACGDTLAGLDNDAGGKATKTPGAFNLVPNAKGWREVEMDATPARIPANWQVKTLADLTTELPKSRMPAGAATATGRVPFFCSSQVPKRTDQALLDGEAVLLGTGGVATVHHGRGGFAWSTDTWALTPTEEACGKWLHETLVAARERIDQIAFKGSGLRHLDKHAMRAWRIACPPKTEQTRIASVLAWQEAQIEDLRKARKVEQKRLTWLVDELLSGRVRVRERSGGAPTVVERDEGGMATETLGAFDLVANAEGWRVVTTNAAAVSIPSSWRCVGLGEARDAGMVEMGRGRVISKKDISKNPGTCPVYSSSVIGNGEFGRCCDYMFDEEMVTWSVDGGGDFFYRHKHKFSVTNVSGWMRVAPEANTKFIHMLLQKQHAEKIFDYQNKAHPSVILGQYHLLLPSLPEQNRITALIGGQERQVADLDALIVIEQKRLAWLAGELLSGRIRVVESAA